MGNNCSTFQLKDQYQYLSQVISPTFGPLKLLHNPKTNKDIALKYIHFSSLQDLNQYLTLIKSSSQSYSKIPTLLKTINCIPDTKLTCQSFGCYLSFEYYQKSLNMILMEKRVELKRFEKAYQGSEQYRELKRLELWDYQRIDRTTILERKYCNIHFLEIEILRMIDHILGALYFLHHVDAGENAIRPENIIIDEEGKYLLICKSQFKLKSNYELSMYESRHIPYLSPEELKYLKNKTIEPRISSQLSNIFSIGVIALEMCTLDPLDKLYDFQQMKLNMMELNRLISNAKDHYSDQFMELLKRMLQINPDKRIDFSTLIDCLNPILVNNIENQVKVYGQNWVKDSQMDMISSKSNKTQKSQYNQENSEEVNQKRLTNVHRRLEEIDEKYNQVMGIKVVKKSFNLKEQYFKRDQESLLMKLKQVKNQTDLKKKKRRMEQQEMKGSQLYDIFLREYNSISESRTKGRKGNI